MKNSILFLYFLTISLFCLQGTNLFGQTPGSVTINKSAQWVSDINNIAKVTLTVDGVNIQRTSDIVLVIDRSGSMEGTK